MIAWRAFRKLAEQTDETHRLLIVAFDRLNATLDRNAAALEDMRDQIRANTEATWRMLDRLDEGGNENPA